MSDMISRQAAIDAVEFGITYAKAINKSTGEVKELFKEGNKALNEAVERLKELPSAEQEPRSPLYYGDGYSEGKMVYDSAECPNCGYIYEEGDQVWGEPYCPHCGQALDWYMRGEQE